MSNGYDFEDVRLVPQKCVVESRLECDTTIKIGERVFDLPVVPANMSSVLDRDLAFSLAEHNLFYIYHRFDESPLEFLMEASKRGVYGSISVGVKDKDRGDLHAVKDAGLSPEYVTIDIAHGWAESTKSMIGFVRELFPSTFIIAGNIATGDAGVDLVSWGADAVKVGIGPGSACRTYHNTGFATRGWQLSAIEDVASKVKDALVIADGGIRHCGDIAKSLVFGADVVMVGGMFAGHDENPGDLIEQDGELMKLYYGSASSHQKKVQRNIEGISIMTPYRGSIYDTFQTVKENLQSSISYAGGDSLEALKSVDYVVVK